MDRGGPVVRWHRTAEALSAADFMFGQDENDGTVHEMHVGSPKVSDWRTRFIDYLYLSTTNSTAFSPTDTILLSSRAKMLMGVESVEALIASLLVISRGVSLLH